MEESLQSFHHSWCVTVVCVVVVSVRPDHDVRLGHVRSQQHYLAGGWGGVDLPDCHCRDRCCKHPSSILNTTKKPHPKDTFLLSVFKVLKEAKVLVWIFVMQNLPEVAFFVYLMYKVRLFFESSLRHIR